VTKQRYILAHSMARQRAAQAVKDAPDGWHVVVSEPTRNLEQNAALWAILSEISEQVIWYGNKLTSEEWKIIFTAALKKQKVVPGIDQGTFVMVGESSSQMTKSDFSDLLELIRAFGAEKEVNFGC